MSDEYLWDRSGEPDAFVADLERRAAPLGDEADALLDELLLLDELETAPASEVVEAVIVALPRAGADAAANSGEAPGPAASSVSAANGRWVWMSAAAALLLTISAMVLLGGARTRRADVPVQVAGGIEPDLRMGVAVVAVEGLTPQVALTELRALHQPLAACAHQRASTGQGALTLALQIDIGSGGEQGAAARLSALEAVAGEIDDETRTCVAQVIAGWQPQAPRPSALRVQLTIEAKN